MLVDTSPESRQHGPVPRLDVTVPVGHIGQLVTLVSDTWDYTLNPEETRISS